MIEDIRGRVDLKPKDIVVDIGANDCTTLAFYPPHLRRVGFEPARNIDWSGVDRSITIINDYFSAKPFEQRFPGAEAKARRLQRDVLRSGRPEQLRRRCKSDSWRPTASGAFSSAIFR